MIFDIMHVTYCIQCALCITHNVHHILYIIDMCVHSHASLHMSAMEFRTHAELPPVDLKATPLITRAN